MIRSLILASVAMFAAAPAFAEAPTCDAQSSARGEAVQHYVPKAMACLERPNAGYWYDDAIEQDMLDRVNAERAALGLSQLALRIELRAPARVHSFDMAQEGFFAHRRTDGRSAFQRISALDRTLVQSEARENLAAITGDMDYATAGQVLHNLLMDSDGHRTNILAPNVTHMAIGVARTQQGAWVTQVFVRQDGTLDQPLALTRRAGEPLAIGAQLSGRDFAQAVLQGTRGREYTPSAAALAPVGDLQLLVVGTQKVDELTYRSIKLNGPSVSVVY